MDIMIRKLVWVVIILLALIPLGAAQQGKHIGDASFLEYEIIYKNFPGILTIDENGATYYFPRWDFTWYAGGNYDERYYGVYPVYFIGQWIEYEIHLKNTGHRTYKNLKIIATQEYYLAYGAEEDEVLPGDPTQEWELDGLRSGEEAVLEGRYLAVPGVRPGLDQTHLQVLHWSKGNLEPVSIKGKVFIDDEEAGLYCPPEGFTVIDL